MAQVYVHLPRENWIIDRIGNEFVGTTSHQASALPTIDPDVVWLLGSWCWKQISPDAYKTRKVLCTVHHEVPEKFEKKKDDFLKRDQYVDAYHVPCQATKDFITQYTNKPIYVLGYWVNEELWYPEDREKCREEFGVENYFTVGSFQRDTEGHDLKTPKLEKGPDLFCDFMQLAKQFPGDVCALLAAWRRQYVIKHLKENKTAVFYNELPDLDVMRRMYNALDLYVVSSRVEGGPQALLEAAIMKIPIVSTRMGMAEDVLHPNCVFDELEFYHPTEEEIEHAYNKAKSYSLQTYITEYDKMIEEVVNL